MAVLDFRHQMVRLAQLVRASDCGSEGRGFETHISPQGYGRQTICLPPCLFIMAAIVNFARMWRWREVWPPFVLDQRDVLYPN